MCSGIRFWFGGSLSLPWWDLTHKRTCNHQSWPSLLPRLLCCRRRPRRRPLSPSLFPLSSPSLSPPFLLLPHLVDCCLIVVVVAIAVSVAVTVAAATRCHLHYFRCCHRRCPRHRCHSTKTTLWRDDFMTSPSKERIMNQMLGHYSQARKELTSQWVCKRGCLEAKMTRFWRCQAIGWCIVFPCLLGLSGLPNCCLDFISCTIRY